MRHTSSRHKPFAELPVQARFPFFLYAQAATARFGVRPAAPGELMPKLEEIWNQLELCDEDISDPDRMNALLKEQLGSVANASVRYTHSQKPRRRRR
jgi:hypothetical protein